MRGIRVRRVLRRLVVALVALLLTLLAVVAVMWQVTPTVADAEQRVSTVLAPQGSSDPQALPAPDPVGEAIIATEDSRFYHHQGLDALGVARAALGFAEGQADPGGATLEQQLAKNLYTVGRSGLAPKAEQVVLALKLDRSYSKQQILEMYLSVVYFGHGHYGLSAAARGYFGVAPNALSWAQASLLAGLVQAPSAYDPYSHAGLARQRQAHVLDRLAATGVLTRARAQQVRGESWGLLPGAS